MPQAAYNTQTTEQAPSTHMLKDVLEALRVFLRTPLSKLPGVGDARTKQLAKLGLHTYRDLLFFFPRRIAIWKAPSKEVWQNGLWDQKQYLLIFKANSISFSHKHCSVQGLFMAPAFHNTAFENKQSASLKVTLYFHPRQKKFLHILTQTKPWWQIYGHIKKHKHTHVILYFPKILKSFSEIDFKAKNCEEKIIKPVYSEVSGLTSQRLAQWVQHVLATMPCDVPTLLNGIPDFALLLRTLHGVLTDTETFCPQRYMHAQKQWLTLQLYAKQIFFAATRLQREKAHAYPVKTFPNIQKLENHLSAQGWRLTSSQHDALQTIAKDMARSFPMGRLLQGDVGSGKTLVALGSLYLNALCGQKGAFLAPTTLLAEQVHHVWQTLFPQHKACLITSSNSGTKRLALTLKEPNMTVVIGTHALLSEKNALPSFSLAVIDEQQRFGVMQRLHLGKRKQTITPHMLFMTATPIPRTAHLQQQGHIDVSYLQLRHPSHRHTYVMQAEKSDLVAQRLYRYIQNGGKAFWICPCIEKKTERAAVDKRLDILKQTFDTQVEAIYGTLPHAQQQHILARFKAGTTRLLVATTVVETGLDVPDAGWMVVEDAPLFGLTTLHQLRGRIGRMGQHATFVILYRTPLSPHARKRLQVLKTCSDGFQLAQQDLELRGTGELWGTQQSGLADNLPWEDSVLPDNAFIKVRQQAIRAMADATWRCNILPFVNMLFLPLSDETHMLQAG